MQEVTCECGKREPLTYKRPPTSLQMFPAYCVSNSKSQAYRAAYSNDGWCFSIWCVDADIVSDVAKHFMAHFQKCELGEVAMSGEVLKCMEASAQQAERLPQVGTFLTLRFTLREPLGLVLKV